MIKNHTPRTDAAEMPIDRVDTVASRPASIVDAEFARQLERNLQIFTDQIDAMDIQIAALKAENELMRPIVLAARDMRDAEFFSGGGNPPETWRHLDGLLQRYENHVYKARSTK